MFSKSEFRDWQRSGVTMALTKGLQSSLDAIKESWARGNFDDPALNYRMLGCVEALNDVLNIVVNGAHLVAEDSTDD